MTLTPKIKGYIFVFLVDFVAAVLFVGTGVIVVVDLSKVLWS